AGLRYYTNPDGTRITRSSTGTLTYQPTNPQKTAQLQVDASTLAVTRRAYDPYGTSRGTTPANWIDNRAYLGQPVDITSGLNLLGARNYDPALGRFLSVDPVLEAGDSNQMGGYTYAGNDPVNGSDPTGLMRDGGGDCGAIHTCNTDPPPTSGTSSTPSPTPSPGPPPPGTGTGTPGEGTPAPSGGFLKNLAGGIGQGVSNVWSKFEDVSCYFGSDDHNCHRDAPLEGPMIKRAAPSEIAKQMFGTDNPELDHNSLPFRAGEVVGEAFALPVPGAAGASEEAAAVALRVGVKGGEKAASRSLVAPRVVVHALSSEKAAVQAESGTGPRTLYHYTNEKAQQAIRQSGELRPSLKSMNPRDARFGDGQYLSDIVPGTLRNGQLAYRFVHMGFLGARFSHYLEIDVTGLEVIQGRPNVFVVPNSGPLDVTNRIVSWGKN
ncbi:HYD1 signature containing ADP-ribosyltransferase family protein, partial [Streptomyces sp. NPDC058301]|uniref:HYD1 signature containing ADP-ribosyltransferase family protein n=1 Tax=Streptomyces sp. NPDC058301 TaxID=3346436 RepID=UPI0036F07B1D